MSTRSTPKKRSVSPQRCSARFIAKHSPKFDQETDGELACADDSNAQGTVSKEFQESDSGDRKRKRECQSPNCAPSPDLSAPKKKIKQEEKGSKEGVEIEHENAPELERQQQTAKSAEQTKGCAEGSKLSMTFGIVPYVVEPLGSVGRIPTPPSGSITPTSNPEEVDGSAAEELQLLYNESPEAHGMSRVHELRTAPVMTREAYLICKNGGHTSQYGVLGRIMSIYFRGDGQVPQDPRLYVNTNAPFSAIVCGVQGSGKSHTISVLLESMFISQYPAVGSLEKPLCGLVLHFGEGGPSSRPYEAAWVGVPCSEGFNTPHVKVFVSGSSLKTMRTVYACLGDKITVEPLFFDEEELDAEAFLTMLAVDGSESTPLYVQIILSILRDLGENYSYQKFTAELENRKRHFNPAQARGLDQRLSLLMSFIARNPENKARNIPRFVAGQLTIIDLSDPFIDPASARGLFEVATRLFVRSNVGTGKVLLVDEAHKYLSSKEDASGLTKTLLTLTREQRHIAMRVLISTQEPTVVPPALLDLCTVAILHRFSSPAWWKHLAQHVSTDVSAEEAFDKIVGLQTGEVIVLAPAGLGVFPKRFPCPSTTGEADYFGRRWIMMKTRRRVTKDGGASILVLGP